MEVDATRFFTFHPERLFRGKDHLVCSRVDELQACRSIDGLVGGVHQASRNRGLVALAQEPWHVGLHHHLFLGHGRSFKQSVVELGIVGKTHEPPSGNTFGQTEAQGDVTCGVGEQSRIEESCLVEILAQLRFRHTSRHVVNSTGFDLALLFAIANGHHLGKLVGRFFGISQLHLGRSHHGGGFHHRHIVSSSLFAHEAGAADAHAIEPVWEHRIVETAQLEVLICMSKMLVEEMKPSCLAPIPPREGNVAPHQGCERPLVFQNLVERLIEEGCHERSLSGCAIGVCNAQCPLFLLSGCEPVAEGGPFHQQSFVGQRFLQFSLMTVEHPIVNPCAGEECPVAILLFIYKGTREDGIALVDGSAFDELVARHQGVDNMLHAVGSAHLNVDGLSVKRELRSRSIEPVVGFHRRPLVAHAEHHELVGERVGATGSNNGVPARCQAARLQLHRLVGSGCALALLTVDGVVHHTLDGFSGIVQVVEGERGHTVGLHLVGHGQRESSCAVAQRQRGFAVASLPCPVGNVGGDAEVVVERFPCLLFLAVGNNHGHTNGEAPVGIGGSSVGNKFFG